VIVLKTLQLSICENNTFSFFFQKLHIQRILFPNPSVACTLPVLHVVYKFAFLVSEILRDPSHRSIGREARCKKIKLAHNLGVQKETKVTEHLGGKKPKVEMQKGPVVATLERKQKWECKRNPKSLENACMK
jgi:hypothetical protein